jgi:hypothetical protein
MLRSATIGLLALAAISMFAVSVVLSEQLPHRQARDEMRVRVPIALQIGTAFGDPFLASNTDVFRAVIVGTGNLDAETMHVLGAVQEDAALMNPYHEDNYYLAAAVLPWGGEVDSGIDVLDRATVSRPWDPMPPYLLGFTYQYFRGDFAKAARLVDLAADRSTGLNHTYFRRIAVRWYEQSANPNDAIGVLRILAGRSRDPGFKQFIALRIKRVEGLIALRQADTAYRDAHGGARANQVGDLIGYAGVHAMPADPTGLGYQLDGHGVPVLASSSPTRLGH